jgi:DNA-binding NarL/FixJ family response regulator
MSGQPVMRVLEGGRRPVKAVCVRLVVVSPDEMLAQRARGILERDGLVVRIEATGPDLAAAARFVRRPTLVIARRSPGGSSLDEVVTWARRVVRSAVLVVVPDVEADELADLLTLGVDGLLLERDLEVALAPVVRSLVGGQVSIPAVLALALAGLSNAGIGRRLLAHDALKEGGA